MSHEERVTKALFLLEPDKRTKLVVGDWTGRSRQDLFLFLLEEGGWTLASELVVKLGSSYSQTRLADLVELINDRLLGLYAVEARGQKRGREYRLVEVREPRLVTRGTGTFARLSQRARAIHAKKLQQKAGENLRP